MCRRRRRGWRYPHCVRCRRKWQRVTFELRAARCCWPLGARFPLSSKYLYRTRGFTPPTANCFGKVCARRALAATFRWRASGRKSFSRRRQRRLASRKLRLSGESLGLANRSDRRGVRMKNLRHSPHGSRWGARQISCFGEFRGIEILAAIGAELIGFRDFALALRAGGMQIAFAIWTEVEAGADRGAALRAIVGKRLAHQQINDEAEDDVAGHQHENEERPEGGVPAAALGGFVDVADHENPEGENYRHTGENAG